MRVQKHEVSQRDNGQILVKWVGSLDYYEILRRAFSQNFVSKYFEDYERRFNWGIFVTCTESERKAIDEFLDLLERIVYIKDSLDETFVLDYHMANGRTKIGELTYQAKYQSNDSSRRSLLDEFCKVIQAHPSYASADFFASVPSYKRDSLPEWLVKGICSRLNKVNGNTYIEKVRMTVPMKDIKTVRDKSDNIRNAFRVRENNPFDRKIVVIIDDIYQSGVTLHELATTLQQIGARTMGLCATKTSKDIE